MVEVFRTNVRKRSKVREQVAELSYFFSRGRIKFDLHDRDKVLRIDGYKNISESDRRAADSNARNCTKDIVVHDDPGCLSLNSFFKYCLTFFSSSSL